MARLVEYIDTSASGGGDGSESDPYENLQEAIDTSAGPGTYGAVAWLCKGSETIDSAGLDWSSCTWVTSPRLLIQGYDTTPGDGGLYEIDVNGSTWSEDAVDDIIFHSLGVTNPGATATSFIALNSYAVAVVNCHFSDFNTDTRVVHVGKTNCWVGGCSFTDINARCIDGPHAVYGCLFYNSGTRTITECMNDGPSDITNCMFALSDGSNGINTEIARNITNNSFYCSDATGYAVRLYKGMNRCLSNVIEGFSVGIELTNYAYATKGIIEANSIYNCTQNAGDSSTAAPANLTHGQWRIIGDSGGLGVANENLSASPFAKSGSVSWANRRAYFEPQDEGSVLGGCPLTGNSRGAIQLTSSGSGSSVIPARPIQIGA